MFRISKIHKALVYLFNVIITIYQHTLSPLLGNNCRFYPSCSHYARESLTEHGFVKGGLMTLKRISSCHPLHPGGYDPVPKKLSAK